MVALVLGESHLPEALPVLQDRWQRSTHPDLRKTALFAIATLRQDEAIQLLLNLLEDGPTRDAKAALNALAIGRSIGPTGGIESGRKLT
jgi:HEAT repeat protein